MNILKKLICFVSVAVIGLVSLPQIALAEEKWPSGPSVQAPSICVMEITTGTILYEHNMDEVNYPASITKIMTGLLAVENSEPDEIVTFSKEAVYGNEGDTSHISRDVNEEMTMEECLYGMMLESANECAYAIGEHIGGGSMKAFTKMMNDRAEQLGCTNTHFNNPNGLPDEDHWTSAHDMALIAAEAYKNETFRAIMGTKSYTIPPTNKHDEETPLHNHHKMVYPFHGDYSYLYDACRGGKTGYTNAAGSTLVTYAQKDNFPIVCVVMREKSPDQYTDTREVFDYCFEHFKLLPVADYEVDDSADEDREPFAMIDQKATIVVPADVTFDEVSRNIRYDDSDEDVLGIIEYSYADRVVGQAKVLMNEQKIETFTFSENELQEKEEALQQEPVSESEGEEHAQKEKKSIHIELSGKMIAKIVGMIIGAVILILLLVWASQHAYIFRQKIATLKSNRRERTRYRTIRDTRKSKRRERNRRSKKLRF